MSPGHGRTVRYDVRDGGRPDQGNGPPPTEGPHAGMDTLPAHAIVRQILAAQRAVDEQHAEATARARRGYAHTIDLARKYGMTWPEIATELGTTPEAARKRYERGA